MDLSQRKKLLDHVICALDLPTMDEALALVDAVGDRLAYYKVGSRMFTRYGAELLDALDERGVKVFLDLKFHDIPNTVADAVESAAGYDAVFMMTVHASGGAEMVRRAARAAAEADHSPKIVAVTALTSLSAEELAGIGVDLALEQWAVRLGRLAIDAGADGLVCSAHEAAAMRERFGDGPLLVTPGIRPEHKMAENDDQSRVMTPKDALATGSSFLVIGRPIYQADDPVEAVEAIGGSL
ncbi:MAG: orotidine-5'-phosphate decarboxylase [Persicimonas sp.]